MRTMRSFLFPLLFVVFIVHEGEGTTSFFRNILLENEELIKDAKTKAIAWLESRRAPDWGWGSDTPRMMMSLHLANESWFHREDLKSQLSLKQLEIELLLEIFGQTKTKIMKPGRLAQFVNALKSFCKNPSLFYNHDLLGKLSNHVSISHPYELAYVVLAQCNSRRQLRKKQAYQILANANSEHDTDTTAMIAMALQCLKRNHQYPGPSQLLGHLMKKLKLSQREDGSFGNIYTSALATQALISTSDEDGSWNATAALHFLLSQQHNNGAFRDVWATSDILPILNGNSYANIVTGQCHDDADSIESEGNSIPKGSLINVTYSLWIDDDIQRNHSISLNMPGNISFYEIMKHAAELDERFVFTEQKTSIGPYIQSINDVFQNPVTGKYWFLGKMDNANKISVVDAGVNELFPVDGDHIIFWYRAMNIHPERTSEV